MKKIFLISSLFIPLFSLSAQEQLKHEPKVYVSPDGKVYMNKSQPVYFKISTSQDVNAPAYTLPSENTPKYANPMYLDTEGRNTLRSPHAIDKATHQVVLPKMEVQFDVYADGLAPNTVLKLSGSKKYINGQTLYCGSNVKAEFPASDATSGVEKTYVSINGEPFTELSAFVNSFTSEKEYSLTYYSVDNVGNVEKPKTIKFYIDLSAPVTSFKIIGDNKGNVISSKASISISGRDTITGIDKIWYSLNDKPAVPYSSPIPISVLNSESSKITYYAIDNVGNKEEPKVISTFTGTMEQTGSSNTYSFYIDKEPPVINCEIEGDQYKGKSLYISERSKLKINASDDKSGVDKVSYSINNFLLKNTYSEPLTLTSAGLQTVYFAAIDNVGNATLAKSQQVVVDATAPSSSVTFTGNTFFNRDTLFINQNTQIAIHATESVSGVKEILYQIDDSNLQPYTTPIKVEKGGFHTFNFQAKDNVNNLEVLKTKKFVVDNEAPQIITNFSVVAIGEKIIRDEKYTIYPSNAILYIAATDNISGGEKIEYRINNSKVWLNTLPVKGLTPGNYDLEVISWDVLKNKSSKTIRFAIEN
jgi:hypothetical protein